LNLSDYSFELPPELIAEQPSAQRGGSRLLLLDRASGRIADCQFAALPSLLEPGDLLVVNNTSVFPARLLGRRLPGGGAAECLLVGRLEPTESRANHEEIWEALVHPGQRLKEGSRLEFGSEGRILHGQVLTRRFHGRRSVKLWTDGPPVQQVIDAIGHVPLPPYIKRPDTPLDRERYQTVFAQQRGSIAAPTAGLHFTPELLNALEARGIQRAVITLHVGYGTFQPIRVEQVEQHHMAEEHFEVSLAAATAISSALSQRRRVIAVGTTTTRALESLQVTLDGRVEPSAGSTNLFIYPGYRFRIVSGLITNFHLPQSSLLLLVSAFGGREHVLAAYRHAIGARYRFYSYGDAMLIV
jgi:S-adenosylmethionine:tRNA ribosyltransferase-isomerase